MKPEEIMIGDWVLCPDNMQRQVRYLQVRPSVIGIGGSSYDEDEIQPIPLTPEILEKNGFSLQSDNTELFKLDTYWLGCELGTFRIHNLNKDWWQFGLAKIRNVHELQHALRLCGINKEIEI